MATRGPKPKARPRGEPGPCPDAPVWLCDCAREEWQRLAPRLNRLGLCESLDRDVLAIYCDALARYQEARAKVREDGGIVFVGDANTPQVSPHAVLMERARKTILDVAPLLGLTPGARSALTGGTSAEPEARGVVSPLATLTARMQARADAPQARPRKPATRRAKKPASRR